MSECEEVQGASTSQGSACAGATSRSVKKCKVQVLIKKVLVLVQHLEVQRVQGASASQGSACAGATSRSAESARCKYCSRKCLCWCNVKECSASAVAEVLVLVQREVQCSTV